MRPWLALCFVAACAACAAQDDADIGCDEDALSLRRVERAVPASLMASGVLSRRSALESNFMRFGRSVPEAPEAPDSAGGETGALRESRADNYMRLGRSASPAAESPSELERLARGEDHNSQGFMRFGRLKAAKDNYLRFGRGRRGSADDDFVRLGRADRRINFLRLGRREPVSNFVRLGRTDPTSNFVRLGRADASGFVRFGRDPSNFVRLGRADASNFVRLGKADASNFVRLGRGGEVEEEVTEDPDDDVVRDARAKQQDNYMRLGRGGESAGGNATDKRTKDSFVRFGRDKSDFVRFGRDGPDGMSRAGRSFVDEQDESSEGEASRQGAQDDSRTKRSL